MPCDVRRYIFCRQVAGNYKLELVCDCGDSRPCGCTDGCGLEGLRGIQNALPDTLAKLDHYLRLERYVSSRAEARAHGESAYRVLREHEALRRWVTAHSLAATAGGLRVGSHLEIGQRTVAGDYAPMVPGDDGLGGVWWELGHDDAQDGWLCRPDGPQVVRLMPPSEGLDPHQDPLRRIAVVVACPDRAFVRMSKGPSYMHPERFDPRGVHNQALSLMQGEAPQLEINLLDGTDWFDGTQQRRGVKATWGNVCAALDGRGTDVFFFVGHGEWQECTEWGGEPCFCLLFEPEHPGALARWVSDCDLADKLTEWGCRVAVLVACDSARAVRALAENCPGLESVVAMQTVLPVPAAETLIEAMLEGLAAWQPVASVVTAGRRSVWESLGAINDYQPGWSADHRPDWAIPVLHVRAQPTEPGCRPDEPGFVRLRKGTYRLGLQNAHVQELAWLWTTDTDRLALQARHRRLKPDSPAPLLGAFKPLVREPSEETLGPLQVATYPTTYHQYRYYLQHNRSEVLPPGFRRDGGKVVLDGVAPDAPVQGLTYEEAEAYCKWWGGRLPTADELEAAARGMSPDWKRELEYLTAGSRHAEVDEGDGRPAVPGCFRTPGGCGAKGLCGVLYQWTQTPGPVEGTRIAVGGQAGGPRMWHHPAVRRPVDRAERSAGVGVRVVFDG